MIKIKIKRKEKIRIHIKIKIKISINRKIKIRIKRKIKFKLRIKNKLINIKKKMNKSSCLTNLNVFYYFIYLSLFLHELNSVNTIELQEEHLPHNLLASAIVMPMPIAIQNEPKNEALVNMIEMKEIQEK